MPHAGTPFLPRPRFLVRDNREPVMLPSNGLITRGVTAWSGDDFDDVVEDNVHVFTGSLRKTVAEGAGKSLMFKALGQNKVKENS